MDERTRKYVARLDALNRRPLAERIEDDVAHFRNRSIEAHARITEDLVRGAWKILKTRPDFRKVLDYRDPAAPDFDAVWDRLMKQRRTRRG